MQFNNYKQRHYNGLVLGSQLWWLNNKSKANAINKQFRNYGKILSQDLSAPNVYYDASSTLNPNPGTQGLRMVKAPVDNSKHIDAEKVKPSNFGKGVSLQEHEAIHKNNILDSLNAANTGRSHFD